MHFLTSTDIRRHMGAILLRSMKTALRKIPVLALLGALLAPVAWSGPIWADDFTDDVSPSDNPDTPGPDLYANWKVDIGIVSMPNLVTTAPAVSGKAVISSGPISVEARAFEPDLSALSSPPSRSSRAPPVL